MMKITKHKPDQLDRDATDLMNFFSQKGMNRKRARDAMIMVEEYFRMEEAYDEYNKDLQRD